MGSKIPVTVVSGFLGSGKTTLLNRLLPNEDGADSPGGTDRVMVLINELGDIGLDHKRFSYLEDNVVLLESGCLCCAVRGQLVATLRDLFLKALHKKIPVFSHVVIETTGIADPAPIMYTLRYEHFLEARYEYAACIAVIDGAYGAQQLMQHREAMQQAVLADVLVISKSDLVDGDTIADLQATLQRINPDAEQHLMQSLPGQAQLLHRPIASAMRVSGSGGRRPGLWSSAQQKPNDLGHGDVQVLTVTWHTPIKRSAFMQAITALQNDEHLELLRIKGAIRFSGDTLLSMVHGVHRHLYPIEQLPPGGQASILVLIFRGMSKATLRDALRALLPGGVEPM